MNLNELFSIKIIPTDISESIYKQRETQNFHTPYKDEIRLLSCIQQGNREKLLEELKNNMPDGIFVGQMSENDIRQSKYMAVSTITLATRYAIQGGLDENEAYKFSDNFIRELDSLDSVQAVNIHIARKIWELTESVAENAARFGYSPHIRKCMMYINKNLNKKITVNELAEECKLSNDYLSHIFKKEVGESISSYILGQKLEAAKAMIFDGTDSGTICYTLGFSSQSYFISSFKKRFGITPGEYAKNN